MSDRARESRIHVVTEIVTGEKPSTKAAIATLDALELEGNVLVVIAREETSSWLSLRNVPEIAIVAPDQINTYDVLISDQVLFTSAALNVFLAGPQTGKSVKAVATESEVSA